MSESKNGTSSFHLMLENLSAAAKDELKQLGLTAPKSDRPHVFLPASGRQTIKKKATHASDVINEAYDYKRPSSFSRGLAVELPGTRMIFLSGTASVDEEGRAAHTGDFSAQCFRTYRNLTNLLKAEHATWHDVVRTTCYLRDIERDYERFNEIRTAFFSEIGLNPLPASTGIQTRLCWPELLVEIELIAMVPVEDTEAT